MTFYQKMAFSLQENHVDLKYVQELSRKAVAYAKNEVIQPTQPRPLKTAKQWEQQRRLTYAACANTYARVLYQLGEWKEALTYSQEAVKITNGENADYNSSYAIVAEKLLPLKQFKEKLEGFVKRGKSTKEIIDVLKRAYVV